MQMPGKVFKMALGCFKPKDVERRTSKELEKKLEEWMQKYNKVIKILLLGPGESGKTTIIKQMKILHIKGFSNQERNEKVAEIRDNLLECIVLIASYMKLYGIPVSNKRNIESLQYIQNIDMSREFEYTKEFFDHVKTLWADSGVQQCYQRGSQFNLPDCAKYFLDRADLVGNPDYVPTDTDILWSRKTTTEIQKIEFSMKIPKKYGGGGTQSFWMFDVGGQRGERRKWIQVFDGIHTILFLAACNVYDQYWHEDGQDRNRLKESIQLFQDVWSSRFLHDSGFIVFLNKQDLLKEKVESGHSIADHFPEYEGYEVNPREGKCDDEYTKTKYFIRDLFLEAKKEVMIPTPRKYSMGPVTIIRSEVERHRDCYWHFTTATDTNSIETVFEDVHSHIITINLKSLGLA